MAQPNVGEGQAEVDWDAVFQTIDHQQGTNVAVADGGTLQSGVGGRVEYPPWTTIPEPVHARRGPGNEEDQSDAELLEFFGQQWNRGEPSKHSVGRNGPPRTMDPPSGLGYLPNSDAGPERPSTGDLNEQYNLAFRAMLGESSEHEGMVPPPQLRSQRGRRRSHSMGPRRTLSGSKSLLSSIPYFHVLRSSPDWNRCIYRSSYLVPLVLPPRSPLEPAYAFHDTSQHDTQQSRRLPFFPTATII